jgi:hypothetical protein
LDWIGIRARHELQHGLQLLVTHRVVINISLLAHGLKLTIDYFVIRASHELQDERQLRNAIGR